ncbi:MAG: hypothetical protein QXI12_10765 [Candidatus Methanomethyliaceae archaeon]
MYPTSVLLDEVLTVIRQHTDRGILGVSVQMPTGDQVGITLDPGHFRDFLEEEEEEEEGENGLSNAIRAQLADLGLE